MSALFRRHLNLYGSRQSCDVIYVQKFVCQNKSSLSIEIAVLMPQIG